jgi:excisionase family DNA binding protein
MTIDDAYVPITTLAEYLHIRVSTVRSWVKCGYIPRSAYLKIGNTYRFNIADVVKALRVRSSTDQLGDIPVLPEADPSAPVQLELDLEPTKDL